MPVFCEGDLRDAALGGGELIFVCLFALFKYGGARGKAKEKKNRERERGGGGKPRNEDACERSKRLVMRIGKRKHKKSIGGGETRKQEEDMRRDKGKEKAR